MVEENTVEIAKEKRLGLEKFRENPWILSSIILALALVLVVIFSFGGGLTGNVVSSSSAAQNLVDFLGQQGVTGLTVDSVNEANGLYEVIVIYQGSQIPLYVTKDGQYFTQSLTPLVDMGSLDTGTVSIPKSDKPKVELFVMSFCPYGNKGEDTMLPVYDLLKDKVDFTVRYIVSVNGNVVSSLHGQPEVDQNIREVCVLENYNQDKFWKFMTYVNNNCGSDGSCWEVAAKNNGLDVNKIKDCFAKDGLTLMKTEAEASNKAGASGSPTMFINGVQSDAVYQYGNSDAYKEAICSAFNDAPEECFEVLSGSTSTAQGGSC